MCFALIIILVAVQAAVAAPSPDTYVFNEIISFLNATVYLLDGPANVSYAPTTPTTNLRPSLEQMKYYNYYCASMYCQYQLNDLSCKYCQKFKRDVSWQRVLMNNDTDNTALITLSTKRKEIVVTFRGTHNVWNIILDLAMLNVPYSRDNGIRIHYGFYIATMSLYREVINYIGRLLAKYPNYKIVLTGHSLGGAMARLTTFFILFLKQFPGKKLELYTYGEPRVGNKGFADFMNAQSITTARVTARADIVPHVIPVSVSGRAVLGDFYIHPQPEYWINEKGVQTFADTTRYNDPTCSDSVGPAYSILDHFQYFDADYLVCYLHQPLVFLALPASILQPVGTIPPLPRKISDFLGDGIGLAKDFTVRFLGR